MNKKNILIIFLVLLLLIVAVVLVLKKDNNASQKDDSSPISSIYDEDLPSSVQSDTDDEEWTSIYEATPVN